MKKGDKREAEREAGIRAALKKEERLKGITLLPAGSGSNFALSNPEDGRFKDEIKF